MSDYQLDLDAQYYTTLISLVVGAVLCIAYDLLRILRKLRRWSYAAVFVQDVAYCLFAAAVTYIMLLVRCSGVVRFYPLLGELCGFFICRFTLSRLIIIIADVIIAAARRVFSAIDRAVFAPMGRLFSRIFKKILVFVEKITYLLKKHLKDTALMVYNHVKLHRGGKCDEGE